MTKIYDMTVDCAACAASIEDEIKQIAGVKKALVSFIFMKLKIEFEEGADEQAVINKILMVARKTDPTFEIKEAE